MANLRAYFSRAVMNRHSGYFSCKAVVILELSTLWGIQLRGREHINLLFFSLPVDCHYFWPSLSHDSVAPSVLAIFEVSGTAGNDEVHEVNNPACVLALVGGLLGNEHDSITYAVTNALAYAAMATPNVPRMSGLQRICCGQFAQSSTPPTCISVAMVKI